MVNAEQTLSGGIGKVGKPEIATQRRVIQLFSDPNGLAYKYIGNLHDGVNRNIKEDVLFSWLTGNGYSREAASLAVAELKKSAADLQHGLYAANESVYSLLKYGVKVQEGEYGDIRTVYFINWDDPSQNAFEIAEEVTIVEKCEKRPDLVIYLNGIAVAVIELKRSSVSVSLGIRQNLTNQDGHYIEPFSSTIQLCMAGNDSEGLRYGTIKTPERFYTEWKNDGFSDCPEERDENDVRIDAAAATMGCKLDAALYSICDKWRFLNILHNFIIFDKGAKKICRYNQYYGIMRAQKRLAAKQNGILWHTQGSGKTLTMVWLSKWIRANLPKSRVLIVTDRDELDEQIERNFKGVNENIVRTKSCADLLQRLNAYDDRLICSLIMKFGRRGGEATEKDLDRYAEDLLKNLPSGFSAKDDIYVFVDECHRTQSGKLHRAMRTIMPKAVFVGFTGTPLLKKDKPTSLEVFGRYIHTYKYNEAVADRVVLDLRYEARDIPQSVTEQEKIDAWFEVKTAGLTKQARAKLKQRWANIQTLFSSKDRLSKIVADIQYDFSMRDRLANGNGNAILIADSIYSACRYYELFLASGFTKCAVISSYNPDYGEITTSSTSDEVSTEARLKYETYLKMVGIDPSDKANLAKKVEEFEKEAKRKFIQEPANMKLLIVVNKLLTGFDAPPCTYLYIDRKIHDLDLFQAVCRVNRLDDAHEKPFGFVVDYMQLFGDLSDALTKYTSEAFSGFSEEDVVGLLKNRKDESRRHFFELIERLDELCEGVEPPGGEIEYQRYFCGNGTDDDDQTILAQSRERLYLLVNQLIRAFADYKPYMEELGASEAECAAVEKRVKEYTLLKDVIGRSSGDFIDLKSYEPDMRYLIDTYIEASPGEKLGGTDDLTLMDFIIAQQKRIDEMGGGADGSEKKKKEEGIAEGVENNLRKKIIEKRVLNPKYFDRLSEILSELVEERRQGAEDYRELLKKYVTLAQKVSDPATDLEHYPAIIRNSAALRAMYDFTDGDESLAQKLHAAVLKGRMADWRNDPVKEKQIKRELFHVFKDKSKVESVFPIVVEQREY